MRRIAAHLVLAAVYAGLFAPLLMTEGISLHACCLRNGAHHCQAGSDEAGYHANRDACPYSAPLPPTASFGLETAKFVLICPAASGFVIKQARYFRPATTVRDLSARAPPISLV